MHRATSLFPVPASPFNSSTERRRRDAAGHVQGVTHARALGDNGRELVTAIFRGRHRSL
jgi:hypothetical protein